MNLKKIKRRIRYILEFRFLPNVSMFLFNNETWLRLLPLKRFFQFVDPNKRIIDIGAGIGSLELALNRTDIFIYDIDRVSIDIAKQNFKNTVVGTGSKINFEDDAFDWAISIHTLEHIPKNEREQFILEMIRISKEGVFLNFPEGKYAEVLCKNFLNTLEKNGLPPNKWTLEHLELGLPTVEEVNSILKKQNKFLFKYKLIRNYKAENIYWTRMRTSNSILFKYFTSPLFALYKYANINRKPTIEMILVGSKNYNSLNDILN
ncbi:MAG TPA: hypothetical protein DCG75_17525 [Bacteroidales bacterium]|nr:hypothetical protein [Bacteroidales bacterium]